MKGSSFSTVTLDNLSRQLAGAVENDDAVVDRAADELHRCRVGRLFAGGFAEALDQNLHPASQIRLGVFQADRILHGKQFVVPPALDFLGYVVGIKLRGLRARAGAVLEDKTVFEAGGADQFDRLPEIVLRLATKADDEIARHRRIGNRGMNAAEHLAVLLDRVAALHPLQHFVRAALRGHVQIRRNLGQIADGREQVVAPCSSDDW